MTVSEIIIDNLYQQRKSGKYCDVRLIVGKQCIWVHSAVICSMSSFITTQYHLSMEDAKPCEVRPLHSIKIKINSLSKPCFECLEKIVDFIYGRTIIVDSEHIDHVYDYCNILNIKDTLLKVLHDTIKSCQNEEICENPVEIKIEDAESHSDANDFFAETSKNSIDSQYSESTQIIKNYQHSESNKHLNTSMPSTKRKTKFSKIPSGKIQKCVGCDFKCYKSSVLLKHLRQTGHGGKVCSLCWTEIDSNENLNEHLILHEDPKPYFCTYCNIRFQSRSLLGQHLPRHMPQKPYSCPHCQKNFKRKHGLNCHLITHSLEKKHLCDECGFSTIHARILRAHQLIHSGKLFKCSHAGCTHSSTRKENIKQHLATHSDEKPFVCELCGHKFTQNKSLKRHSLIHSQRGLDNVCPHCPFRARRIDNLKAHVLRQHSIIRHPKIDFLSNNSETIMIEPDVENIVG